MIRIGLVIFLCWVGVTLAKPVTDYLPDSNNYDPAIPKPASVLGWTVGDWHVRHDQLATWHRSLAEASARIEIEQIGRSHEQRPLQLLTITHPDNFARLDELRQKHLNGDADAPLVLWFGYSVHGNESSGANAGLLFVWHLAALQDRAFDEALRNTIILVEPAINPDGLSRFAQWANSHRSTTAPVADRANREHQEVWPGGRFNHYWFDLNRDWLLLTHPESAARIEHYQKWRPHVLTDFHEMGSDATYFFQPGAPNRTHPLTPEGNVELTAKLAGYHARALDAAGELYYSEESFDDFYYGKGSTYPDVQGSVGILFEQASSRGHLMDTINGPLSFEQSIQNQLTTSLSTLAGSLALADELKAYQTEFFRTAASEASADSTKAWVFGDRYDLSRGQRLAELLTQHDIEVFELAERLRTDGVVFEPGSSWVVPTGQRQYRLIKAMFERRTEFADSTFYDVSAWTMPLAFGLPHVERKQLGGLKGEAFQARAVTAADHPPAYAYALVWSDYAAPRALTTLLAAKLHLRVLTKPIVAQTPQGPRRFERGTVMVVKQQADLTDVLTKLGPAVANLVPISSGLTPEGIDIGSPSAPPLKPVKPMILVGPGVNGPEVGEIWHLLDTRVGLPLVMVDKHRLPAVAIEDYSHIIMVDGSYGDFDKDTEQRLADWVKAGGVLISQRRGAAWLSKSDLLGDEPDEQAEDESETKEPVTRRAYADHTDDFSQTVIGGTIVDTRLDITHPLAYGYMREALPVLHRGTTFLELSDNPYETVAQYTEQPLLAGFLGAAREHQMAGSAALIASKLGQGAVIRFTFNPNFRGVWYGTNKLFLNALFFGQLIDSTPVPDTEKRL